MHCIDAIISLFFLSILGFAFVSLIFLIIRRIRIKKEENFEKRNN